MHYSIVPSLPAQSYGELTMLLDALQGISDGFQIDIVDGKFVPLISWPFTEKDPIASLEQLKVYAEQYELEIDCMVMNPEQYLDTFVEVGFQRVIIHYGSTDAYDEIFAHSKKHGYKLGIAGTNDIPIEDLISSFEKVDFVQIMGIARVGEQGQPFDKRTLETVAKLRDLYPELEIAVDGSVNEETIPRLLAAGVNRFAPGSAIAKARDPVNSYKHLKDMII